MMCECEVMCSGRLIKSLHNQRSEHTSKQTSASLHPRPTLSHTPDIFNDLRKSLLCSLFAGVTAEGKALPWEKGDDPFLLVPPTSLVRKQIEQLLTMCGQTLTAHSVWHTTLLSTCSSSSSSSTVHLTRQPMNVRSCR